jgi:ribose transport system ATP-binding protein
MQALLSINNLTKVFPGQTALDDVSITLHAGRTRALVGQNGSGKSTLIKVLAGYHQPTAGTAEVVRGGKALPFTLGDGLAAASAGIRFVHQDLALVDAVSTVENLALGTGFLTSRFGRIDWPANTKRAEAALADLGFDEVAVTAPVGSLAPSQKTAVAVARALQGWEHGASLLVLDEPTASLPDGDVERLFQTVRRLKERGVAILYVSHHLDEVFEIADDVTVLRDGRHVVTETVADLDHDRLVELMIGHRLERRSASPRSTQSSPVLLQTHQLTGGSVRGVSIAVQAGEVLGVAGITGSGRDHLLPLISGQLPSASGSIVIDSTAMPNYKPAAAMAAGGAFLAADRSTQGNLALLSVTANTTISDLRPNVKWGRLLHAKEGAEATTWVDRLSTRLPSIDSPIATLSGGNQQKVLLARGLRLAPKVLALDEPTRGVDVGAKEEIHSIIDAAAANGSAVIVASTDTDELVRVSHRVIVFRRGEIAVELVGDQITSEAIIHAQSQVSATHSPAASSGVDS